MFLGLKVTTLWVRAYGLNMGLSLGVLSYWYCPYSMSYGSYLLMGAVGSSHSTSGCCCFCLVGNIVCLSLTSS